MRDFLLTEIPAPRWVYAPLALALVQLALRFA